MIVVARVLIHLGCGTGCCRSGGIDEGVEFGTGNVAALDEADNLHADFLLVAAPGQVALKAENDVLFFVKGELDAIEGAVASLEGVDILDGKGSIGQLGGGHVARVLPWNEFSRVIIVLRFEPPLS